MYTILSISDSDKHFSTAITEYTKRLGKLCKIENIKPTKHGSKKQIIAKDTENILTLLEKKYQGQKKILLSKEGQQVDTFAFKNLTKAWEKIVYVIGGPYGLDENNLEKSINKKIAFGQATLPHGLAKLVLIEQIYRSETLKSGKKYHY